MYLVTDRYLCAKHSIGALCNALCKATRSALSGVLNVFLLSTCPKIFDTIISRVSVNMVNNLFSRINAVMHEVDDAVSPIKLAIELHAIVTVSAHAYDWTYFSVTSYRCLEAA